MEPTAVSPRIACTFNNCNRTFATAKELRKHKIQTIDHEYCARCDLDFDDEKELLYHKLDSNMHIVCPCCGEEFKSEGGKNTHFHQVQNCTLKSLEPPFILNKGFHKANQDMECHFCDAKFSRAQSYVSHIENDQCPSYSAKRYKEERAKKEALRTVMSRTLGPAGSNLLLPAPSNSSSVNGGVQLSLLDGDDTVSSSTASKSSTAGGAGWDTTSVSVQLRGMSLWPAPGQQQEAEMDPDERDLITYSEVGYDRDDDDATSHNRSSNSDFPTTPKGKSALLIDMDDSASRASGTSWGTWKSSSVARPETEVSNEPVKVEWSVDKFFSPTLGKYLCVCDKAFDSEKEFDNHIKSGVHAAGVFRCPSCLRMFKTSTALTAHCEAATVRCKVNRDENYARIMDEISGGLIEPIGENEDGTIRYRTVPPEKKTIDIKNVKW
ncbi:hypothetical protein AJ79_05456 [Helicocarpus griseus UAMH5409]|uniref:C2H2-type domain-containing protein n=1 Tax=Helicocarpus griseus UAMH5409 TaxID=1447875 RepID=A0A2B7XPJ3_9EURO|nr:hypothetical protein AJ79_05456 [Helicocarpus griseus UAMH5409]